MTSGGIIVFDGVCNFCNGAVRFVLRWERRADYRFAPMQGETAQRLLAKHQIDGITSETLVLFIGDTYQTQSTAVLTIAAQLKRPWSWLVWLRVLPTSWCDSAYRLVARNRYRLFGRLNECPTPSPGLHSRFLA